MAIAKVSEIKVSSKDSFDDAIKTGIARANKTLKNVKSAWVKDLEVSVDENGMISEYKVLLKITFILEEL
ncbi:MAG: dodecin family protein [Actinomycetota bacterium]|nr:dodecin family protein [Actinomycetota bacterium]